MGLSNLNPLRSRDAKRPKLPMYKQVKSGSSSSPTKERYSDVEDSSDDYSSDDTSDSSSRSRPSPRRSRPGSSSASSNSRLMAQRQSSSSQRRPSRRHFYRLPNKIIRVLCIGLITTIVVFIFGLVRASQVENRRIAEGKVEKKPPPPPPWENFKFLTRYYGGLKTLVPVEDNVPQYPRFEDEAPYNATAPSGQQQPDKSGKRDTTEGLAAAVKSVPPSKPFMDHSGSVVPNSHAEIQECFLDEKKSIRIPLIHYYDGRPSGFPDNVIGSYELLSLPEDICFDRFGRYGPYGYGYSVKTGGLGVGEHGDRAGAEEVWKSTKQVDWNSGKIDWAEAQRRCFQANEDRYKPVVPHKNPLQGFYIKEDRKPELKVRADVQASETTTATKPADEKEKEPATPEAPKHEGDIPRSALVIRAWDEIDWNAENILNLRALVAEISLASGGCYDVHLLVQVRNDGRNPVWADDEVYQKHINDTIPAEFRGMVTLWSETQMLAIYQGVRDLWTKGPELPVHGSYRGLQMAMQYFAYKHPEYEQFWQWEMDIRYTGHYYDLLSKLEAWAKEQPRKGLWERNARFYMPYVHGTWDDFKQMARVQTEHGTVGADNIWDNAIKKGGNKDNQEAPNQVKTKGEKSIWGPERPNDPNDWYEHEQDPAPPTSYERDKYSWGVGEEADLITLNPIFNPEGTTWELADDITGYNETVPGSFGKPPRRAQIITASRMSRRLLLTMHRETAFKKHHAFPEMWPATVALHHGYKAVFAPHPLFVDREWPTEYMAHILNGGRNGASGGSRTSVFGNREHNMKGLTWFYNAGFSANLYKRWLGLKVNNDGGEQFELSPDNSADDQTVSTMRGGEGRMCLPPMLLHPVKDVVLPVEQEAEEAKVEIPESDPSA
ncbi:hypothetical protein B0T20DRAFT_85542 [Sordaria brevicollis]|uniref:Uncharacterized protein n=1 Tax=Sordaria brevicollis TaxID=83679 RepID=A0AAE0NWD7_SORBR|nr:hypothetical protein B0T20DRAFT_85542 [Sordaria brevicollis]